jgi:hypothetical protein
MDKQKYANGSCVVFKKINYQGTVVGFEAGKYKVQFRNNIVFEFEEDELDNCKVKLNFVKGIDIIKTINGN